MLPCNRIRELQKGRTSLRKKPKGRTKLCRPPLRFQRRASDQTEDAS